MVFVVMVTILVVVIFVIACMEFMILWLIYFGVDILFACKGKGKYLPSKMNQNYLKVCAAPFNAINVCECVSFSCLLFVFNL